MDTNSQTSHPSFRPKGFPSVSWATRTNCALFSRHAAQLSHHFRTSKTRAPIGETSPIHFGQTPHRRGRLPLLVTFSRHFAPLPHHKLPNAQFEELAPSLRRNSAPLGTSSKFGHFFAPISTAIARQNVCRPIQGTSPPPLWAKSASLRAPPPLGQFFAPLRTNFAPLSHHNISNAPYRALPPRHFEPIPHNWGRPPHWGAFSATTSHHFRTAR